MQAEQDWKVALPGLHVAGVQHWTPYQQQWSGRTVPRELQTEVVTGVEAENWAREEGDMEIEAWGHPVTLAQDVPLVLLYSMRRARR